jgi:hypothetical protein
MFPLEMSIIEVEYHRYLLKALQIVYFKKAKFVLSESAKRFLKFALGCIRQAALGLVVARVPLLLAPSWPFFSNVLGPTHPRWAHFLPLAR